MEQALVKPHQFTSFESLQFSKQYQSLLSMSRRASTLHSSLRKFESGKLHGNIFTNFVGFDANGVLQQFSLQGLDLDLLTILIKLNPKLTGKKFPGRLLVLSIADLWYFLSIMSIRKLTSWRGCWDSKARVMKGWSTEAAYKMKIKFLQRYAFNFV